MFANEDSFWAQLGWVQGTSFICPRNEQEPWRLGAAGPGIGGEGTCLRGTWASSKTGGRAEPVRSSRAAMRLPQTRPRKVQCHAVCCAISNITPSPWCQPTEKSPDPKASCIMGPVGKEEQRGELGTQESPRAGWGGKFRRSRRWRKRSCQERNGSSREPLETCGEMRGASLCGVGVRAQFYLKQ